ncbi:hypothetical protein [Patulibacter defluvii]|uniref:hypothetical protein n=1 Tax=Patulibacter defluvii TaxID=3095358 RepID=UPI002A7568BD|nr:hypothetical protein [Patulibacter sp. DM4]
MSNLPRRAAKTAGALGASAAMVAAGIGAAAAPATASQYATGWQCISPFANFTNGTYPDDPPAPDRILDSLAVAVARPDGEAISAEKGKKLTLRDLQLSLAFKDTRPALEMYRRTAGVSINWNGKPAEDPADPTHATNRTLTVRTVPAGTPAGQKAGGVADGDSAWSFSVGSGGSATVYYVEKLASPWAPPSAYGGGYIQPAGALGHRYLSHTGNNNFPIDNWVTIEATNTVEKYQTLRVKGFWTVNIQDTTPGSPTNPAGYNNGGDTVSVPDLVFDLPRSNWTPTGDGPVEFRVAPPGNSAIIQVEGKGYDFPDRNKPLNVRPFGSVYVRAETEAYGASNDCIPGTIALANNTIANTFFGAGDPNGDPALGDPATPGFVTSNNGSLTAAKGATGRYALTFAAQPAIATAPLKVPDAVAVAKPFKIASGSLKRSTKGRVTVKVTNPNSQSASYKVSIKTTAKYKVGKGGKKLQTVTKTTSAVTVGAGKSKSVSPALSSAAKTLLKSRKSIKVKVTITPTDGKRAKKVSKTLTLKR